MANQRKILVWADAPMAPTGFGTVTRYVLEQLHKTGEYEVDVLAINYYGQFYDSKEFPYQIVPARMGDPRDPYGNKMLLEALQRKDYDLLWILNDTHVVNGIVDQLDKLRTFKQQRGQKVFKVVFHYPIDCTVIEKAAKMIRFADAAVCITEYGKQETLKKMPDCNKDIDVVYHGCDPAKFHKVQQNMRRQWRARYLSVKSPDTFLWINTNRNSIRKDMARNILAFKEFRKHVPDSRIYLHCAHSDNNIELAVACEELGLSNKTDVLFPARLDLKKGGYPVEILNGLYNTADAFMSTTLGEGWGLTATEAMSAGLPILLPNNSSAPEIIGENEERGYMYECEEQVWIDNSGYRPQGRLDTIVEKMLEVYEQRGSREQMEKLFNAKMWVNEHTWEIVSKKWFDIFERVLSEKTPTGQSIAQEV